MTDDPTYLQYLHVYNMLDNTLLIATRADMLLSPTMWLLLWRSIVEIARVRRGTERQMNMAYKSEKVNMVFMKLGFECYGRDSVFNDRCRCTIEKEKVRF